MKCSSNHQNAESIPFESWYLIEENDRKIIIIEKDSFEWYQVCEKMTVVILCVDCQHVFLKSLNVFLHSLAPVSQNSKFFSTFY